MIIVLSIICPFIYLSTDNMYNICNIVTSLRENIGKIIYNYKLRFSLYKSDFANGWVPYVKKMIYPREGNLGVILVRVCEPVFQNLPHSYTWPLKRRTHSYTWSSKMLTYSYTALWFFVPIYCWLLDKNHKISLNTMRTSSFEKSLSEKYVHIPGCQKMRPFT